MAKIPVYLVSGFLGSGKTSLLKSYIEQTPQLNTAFIINELGQIALDQRILQNSYVQENMLYLNAGCVCCNKRLDLIQALKDTLAAHEARGQIPDSIIIESTGLAKVAPILWTLQTDTFLSHHFNLQGVLTCIDSLNALSHLSHDEAREQIIASDRLILTKTDLQSPSQELLSLIKELNPSLEPQDKAHLDYSKLFDGLASMRLHTSPSPSHDIAYQSLALSFHQSLDWNAFSVWLSLLLHKYGQEILRVKGILDTGKDFLVSINGVGHSLHTPSHIPRDEIQGSSLIFITRNLDKEQILSSLQGFERLLGVRLQETH